MTSLRTLHRWRKRFQDDENILNTQKGSVKKQSLKCHHNQSQRASTSAAGAWFNVKEASINRVLHKLGFAQRKLLSTYTHKNRSRGQIRLCTNKGGYPNLDLVELALRRS